MIAYKVFSKVGDRFFSSNKKLSNSILSQEYFLSVNNVPKFPNPIFCFETLSDARKFAFDNMILYDKRFEIWKVVGNRSDITNVKFYPAYAIKFHFKDFNNIKFDAQLPTKPVGTVYLDTVLLISKEE